MEKRKGHAAFGAKVIMRCKWYTHKISMTMASILGKGRWRLQQRNCFSWDQGSIDHCNSHCWRTKQLGHDSRRNDTSYCLSFISDLLPSPFLSRTQNLFTTIPGQNHISLIKQTTLACLYKRSQAPTECCWPRPNAVSQNGERRIIMGIIDPCSNTVFQTLSFLFDVLE